MLLAPRRRWCSSGTCRTGKPCRRTAAPVSASRRVPARSPHCSYFARCQPSTERAPSRTRLEVRLFLAPSIASHRHAAACLVHWSRSHTRVLRPLFPAAAAAQRKDAILRVHPAGARATRNAPRRQSALSTRRAPYDVPGAAAADAPLPPEPLHRHRSALPPSRPLRKQNSGDSAKSAPADLAPSAARRWRIALTLQRLSTAFRDGLVSAQRRRRAKEALLRMAHTERSGAGVAAVAGTRRKHGLISSSSDEEVAGTSVAQGGTGVRAGADTLAGDGANPPTPTRGRRWRRRHRGGASWVGALRGGTHTALPSWHRSHTSSRSGEVSVSCLVDRRRCQRLSRLCGKLARSGYIDEELEGTAAAHVVGAECPFAHTVVDCGCVRARLCHVHWSQRSCELAS